VVVKKLQNIILIINMDAQRWNTQFVPVIGEKTRRIREKDMEQKSGLMETDTSGNT
jgi:hypothetical protein